MQDLELWKSYIDQVDKLDKKPINNSRPALIIAEPKHSNQVALPSNFIRKQEVQRRKLQLASTADIDNTLLKKMNAGELAIDGKIDFHGKIIKNAHVEFLSFVANAYAANKRLLLVITGKGLNSSGVTLIRTELPHWVNDHRIAHTVLRFCFAHRKHGGEGAYYILLRKNK